MHFSRNNKYILIGLLLVLNILLRQQVVFHEIGSDSFFIHMMTNSLSEFGYAKWFLHPLSIIGIYPASYTSTIQFLLSGISQSTGIEMEPTIYLYCIFIGSLSVFTSYLMAGEIIDNDVFKFFAAFAFSISPAVVGYTTWTIAGRNLLVIFAPLFIYLLLKSRTSIKQASLFILFGFFLLMTHHLFYFLIPAVFAFFIIAIFSKYRGIFRGVIQKYSHLIITLGFIFMFSIPFFTGRFIETSRYDAVIEYYVRYMGILIVPAIGGLMYLIFKQKKNTSECLLLLTLIFLTTFIYEQTYMKWFLPIFLVPLASAGLLNILNSLNKKYAVTAVVIFLLVSVCFTGYYQFLNPSQENSLYERFIKESTYNTGLWMKENMQDSAISNDVLLGHRIFATAETTHLVTSTTVINQIYGFITIDMSEFERYPVTSEEFWFSGYMGPDVGESTWKDLHLMRVPSKDFRISYVVENQVAKGRLIWRHGFIPSKLLEYAYENNCIFDIGTIRIWSFH